MEIELLCPGEAEDTVLVCFVQKGYGITPAAHKLVACEFGDIDQDRQGCDVISSDVICRRLSRERV